MNRDARTASEEILRGSANGYAMLGLGLLLLLAGLAVVRGAPILGAPLVFVGILILAGIYMLQPNQAALLLLFGDYRGTDRSSGLRWCGTEHRCRRARMLDGLL